MPQVSVIHPGTQHSPHLARELNRLGLLKYYITSIGVAKNSYIEKTIRLLPELHRKLSLRFFEEIPSKKIKTYPSPELLFLIKQKINSQLDIQKVINKRNENIQLMTNSSYIDKSDIIVGYDTSSWIIAQRAKNKGKKFILDQSTCHSNTKLEYMNKLYDQYPEWYKKKSLKKPTILLEQEKIEHDLADLIVVPSLFVKKSLVDNGVHAEKIITNPYGTNNTKFTDLGTRNHDQNSLIFLFVGAVNANKGIPDLIKAWIELNLIDAELWIVGYGDVPENIKIGSKSISFLGKISKDNLPEIYNKAHVFIFPSYFEGLAQVQIEALSCGLPIIGTYNSGASELITVGENGLLIKSGNIMELKNAIIWFCNNKDKLEEMSKKAKLASKNLTWQNYGNRWKDIIENL